MRKICFDFQQIRQIKFFNYSATSLVFIHVKVALIGNLEAIIFFLHKIKETKAKNKKQKQNSRTMKSRRPTLQ